MERPEEIARPAPLCGAAAALNSYKEKSFANGTPAKDILASFQQEFDGKTYEFEGRKEKDTLKIEAKMEGGEFLSFAVIDPETNRRITVITFYAEVVSNSVKLGRMFFFENTRINLMVPGIHFSDRDSSVNNTRKLIPPQVEKARSFQ